MIDSGRGGDSPALSCEVDVAKKKGTSGENVEQADVAETAGGDDVVVVPVASSSLLSNEQIADIAATGARLYEALSPESMASLMGAINAGAGNGVMVGSEIIPIPQGEPAEAEYGGTMAVLVLGERALFFHGGVFSTREPALIASLDAYIATGATGLWRVR